MIFNHQRVEQSGITGFVTKEGPNLTTDIPGQLKDEILWYRFKSCIDDWVNYILHEAEYSPKGMIYIDQWGTLRHASNVAHVCAQLTKVGQKGTSCTCRTIWCTALFIHSVSRFSR